MSHRHHNSKTNKFTLAAAWLQAVYYVITGVWPLLSISTFMAATGPKTDVWLVKTVGLLILAIGITLLSVAIRKAVSREIILLGILSIASLTFIDFYYSFNDTISNIYLADAFAEILLLLLWLTGISIKK